ncbi:flagellar export chaperone FliS [Roseicyclus sp.]|mgnify:FL=1|jgi:flagellar secretion chaperone FliS|uniref:flagellar export chaperone FliS n=1 Tax=Roseicyclus sp. TaxID=1914329 RepID=UPI004053DAC0
MNYALARSKYIHDHRVQVNDISDPHATILVVMQELNKNLRKIADPENRALDLREQFTKAFTAIYILETSLDFARGGEIAENLFRLYEYCRHQLLQAFASKQDNSLDSCVVMLDEIIQSWEAIKKKPGG